MYRTGHYGVSLLLYAPVGVALAVLASPGLALLGGAVVLALARVPDYDHRIPGITHRGVTHTLAFALLVGAAFAGGVLALARAGATPLSSTETVTPVAFAFGVGTFGILAHLAGDVLTPAGVPLLWPLSARSYSVSFTTADSRFWNAALFALGVFATAASAALLLELGFLP